MASNDLFFMIDSQAPQEEPFEIDKATLWVVDFDGIIRPSTTLSLIEKLPSDIYKLGYSREFGSYCKKVNIASDELFVFSDSIVPDILSEINLFLDKADIYKHEKLVHKRGILLYGHPGCGKTSIISLMCNEFFKKDGVAFIVSESRNLEEYISFMKNSFRKIQPETPVITIIEDIDSFDDMSLLLDFFEGKSQLDHHIIVATSNNTQNIPDTLLRPSRIDLRVEISLPSKKVRREYLENKNVKDPEVIDKIISVTDGYSFADLKEIYIAMFVLDYSLEMAIEKLGRPTSRKDYNFSKNPANKFGI